MVYRISESQRSWVNQAFRIDPSFELPHQRGDSGFARGEVIVHLADLNMDRAMALHDRLELAAERLRVCSGRGRCSQFGQRFKIAQLIDAVVLEMNRIVPVDQWFDTHCIPPDSKIDCANGNTVLLYRGLFGFEQLPDRGLRSTHLAVRIEAVDRKIALHCAALGHVEIGKRRAAQRAWNRWSDFLGATGQCQLTRGFQTLRKSAVSRSAFISRVSCRVIRMPLMTVSAK